MKADWYFDFISPFSYFQFLKLGTLPSSVQVTLKPVLFAGLLNANGQKGPAEIPAKRIFTYRHVIWRARRDGVPFTMPKAHPFNPIKALRLAVALGATPAAVSAIYHAIWGEGHLPDDAVGWQAIQKAAGVTDGDALIADAKVKQGLIANGEAAVAAGVFGVPSFVADGQIFWGDDATQFFLDWVADPGVLNNAEMRAVDTMPSSATRV